MWEGIVTSAAIAVVFSSQPTGDRWDDAERMIDLGDPTARKIVIADLVGLVQRGDKIAPETSILDVHVDNVHMLDAAGVATVFNEFCWRSNLRGKSPKRGGWVMSPRTIPKHSGRRLTKNCLTVDRPFPASSRNRFSQMPRSAQPTKRL
jgi:hypothetical protein